MTKYWLFVDPYMTILYIKLNDDKIKAVCGYTFCFRWYLNIVIPLLYVCIHRLLVGKGREVVMNRENT